jgi:hypothetical protein
VRLDALEWVHRIIATTARELWIRLRRSRRRLKKSLDDLNREIWNARLPDAADSSEEPLDVDALASTEELRLIIGLHLDGWSWHEINKWLHNR